MVRSWPWRTGRAESAAPPRPGRAGRSAAKVTGQDRTPEYRRKRRIIRTGQVLMVLGVVVAVVHVLAHLGMFGGQPSGLVDLLAGYPMAAVLVMVGAIAAGQ